MRPQVGPNLLDYIMAHIFNTLGPRQNGRHVVDDIFKCPFYHENFWISIKISMKFVPKGLINNIPALLQILAWRRPGDKPLSEPMMVSSPTHIYLTRPQWVNNIPVSFITLSLHTSVCVTPRPNDIYVFWLARLLFIRYEHWRIFT